MDFTFQHESPFFNAVDVTSWFACFIILNSCVLCMLAHQDNRLPLSGGLNCSISTSEFEALENFYAVCDGANWKWNESLPTSTIWNFDNATASEPCTDDWQGLKCFLNDGESELCYISAIILDAFGLRCQLPTVIGSFQNLTALSLSNNTELTGETQHINNKFGVELIDLDRKHPQPVGKHYQIGVSRPLSLPFEWICIRIYHWRVLEQYIEAFFSRRQ